jgi:arylsulfatase A-like enzyme
LNVIWIVADTFRRDHLGCYGNEWIRTPALDSFAAQSLRFDRHYSGSFPTMPNRADFFTGRLSGIFMRWQPLARELNLLPSILRRNRIHTAAVVDTPFFLRDNMNYDRGFRTFIEIEGQDYWSRGLGDDTRSDWRHEADRYAPRTITRAAQWLEKHHRENFFLYIDTWDPHEPWDAPDYYTKLYLEDYDGEIIDPTYSYWQDVENMTEDTVRKAHACYCGEITMVDTWIGHFLRLTENMGLMDNTAIIFTTDHGFYFGEHGGLFGKMTLSHPQKIPYWFRPNHTWIRSPLWEETISCPLIIHMPNIEPGVQKGLTSAIDLMPTVLNLMNVEVPPIVEGFSLIPMMKNKELKGRDFVISAHPFTNAGAIVRSVDGQQREIIGSDVTITTEEWSLLYSIDPGQSWLYHLPSDPKQQRNVINEHISVAQDLHQKLVNFMKESNLNPELLEPRLELRLESTAELPAPWKGRLEGH